MVEDSSYFSSFLILDEETKNGTNKLLATKNSKEKIIKKEKNKKYLLLLLIPKYSGVRWFHVEAKVNVIVNKTEISKKVGKTTRT